MAAHRHINRESTMKETNKHTHTKYYKRTIKNYRHYTVVTMFHS